MQIYYKHDILDEYGISYGCELLSAGVHGGRGVGEGVLNFHDDVIKWNHFPRYWPFVWGIRRSIPFTKDSDAELWYCLWSAPK